MDQHHLERHAGCLTSPLQVGHHPGLRVPSPGGPLARFCTSVATRRSAARTSSPRMPGTHVTSIDTPALPPSWRIVARHTDDPTDKAPSPPPTTVVRLHRSRRVSHPPAMHPVSPVTRANPSQTFQARTTPNIDEAAHNAQCRCRAAPTTSPSSWTPARYSSALSR